MTRFKTKGGAMGEYMSAEINIGSPLTADGRLRLIAAVLADNPRVGDWAGEYVTEESLAAAIDLAVAEGTTLALYDEQASWGKFEETEEVCEKLGLNYLRECEGNEEYDPEKVWWAPGMEGSETCLATASGSLALLAEDVRKAIDEGGLAAVEALLVYEAPVEPPALTLASDDPQS